MSKRKSPREREKRSMYVEEKKYLYLPFVTHANAHTITITHNMFLLVIKSWFDANLSTARARARVQHTHTLPSLHTFLSPRSFFFVIASSLFVVGVLTKNMVREERHQFVRTFRSCYSFRLTFLSLSIFVQRLQLDIICLLVTI